MVVWPARHLWQLTQDEHNGYPSGLSHILTSVRKKNNNNEEEVGKALKLSRVITVVENDSLKAQLPFIDSNRIHIHPLLWLCSRLRQMSHRRMSSRFHRVVCGGGSRLVPSPVTTPATFLPIPYLSLRYFRKTVFLPHPAHVAHSFFLKTCKLRLTWMFTFHHLAQAVSHHHLWEDLHVTLLAIRFHVYVFNPRALLRVTRNLDVVSCFYFLIFIWCQVWYLSPSL